MADMMSFEAQSLAEPRLVWDPAVHRHYGEDLYFLLLSLTNPTDSAIAGLQKHLEKLNFGSHAVYKVYGAFDAVVQVWATPSQLNELLEAITDDPRLALAEDAQERLFSVRHAYYDDWTTHRANSDIRYIQRYGKDIDLITSRRGHGRHDEVLDRLKQAQLVHEFAPAMTLGDGSLIQVLCLLSHSGQSRVGIDAETTRVRQIVSELPMLHHKSLYRGTGAEVTFLVKGLVAAKDYSAVDDWVSNLLERIGKEKLSFRSTTLLVGSDQVQESKVIAPRRRELSPEEEAFRRTIAGVEHDRIKYAPAIRAMSSSERDKAVDLFDSFKYDLLDTQADGYFVGFFRAWVTYDPKLLTESLIFVLSLEGMIHAKLVRDLFPKKLGKDWYRKVDDIVHGAPISAERADRDEREDLTLGQLVRAVRDLVKRGDISDEDVAERFGPDWSHSLDYSRDLRNKLAHGRISAEIDAQELKGKWAILVEEACRAGKLFNRLKPDPPTNSASSAPNH